jgi:hypothetical protein
MSWIDSCRATAASSSSRSHHSAFILDQNKSIAISLLSKMSSKKRVSVSPASISVAGLKRQRGAPDENEDLQCLICFELVVDAVQVRCCGALHCRACISKCEKCPMCRKPVSADTIMPDVRCERLSAAAVRPCLYAEDGCVFKGNRASTSAHEEICDFVPRSVLREKIQKVSREQNEQTLLHMNERFRLIAEKSAIAERAQAEKLKMQEALMKCALGPNPAQAALRVLYELPAAMHVIEINREVANGKSLHVCTFKNAAIKLSVHESNHNVAIWFEKLPAADEKFPDGYPASHYLVGRLLHPHDVTRTKEIRMRARELNGKQKAGFENFMTSKQLDEYCFDGKYYFA